jgi:Periplasmic copper-binding protein (NosD).
MNTTLNWNSVHHAVVNGNYFYNEYTAIHLGDSNNLTFYQNDFVNFTQALILSGKYSNITFNSSYPVGGNYWSNYTGSDKYSGPGQNIPGSDGIGDTPYSIGYGLMDKYPLMKPWTRPAVTFTESGLAAGKSWSVQFDGNIYSTDNNSISFLIHNSTYQIYRYALQNVSGYYFNSSPSGNFSYSGNGTTYSFVYYHYAYLTGTVSPGQVTVKIGNTTYNITDGVFNISLKAGSYKIEFIHSGYVTLTYQLTLNAGENKNLTVSLTKPSSDIIYYIVGGIAAVVVAGGAAFAIYRKK